MDQNKLLRGKIVKGIAGFYYVAAGDSIYECKAKGGFRNQKLKPLIGDNVVIDVIDEEKNLGNIREIEARENELIRPAVANVDQAFIVFAAVSPEIHFGLLDRFLVMMEYQDVPTAICINKEDQGVTKELQDVLEYYKQAGYEVHFISTIEKTGLEGVRKLLDGKTTVFAGASGVGKSSILNCLSDVERMEVGSISERLGRGRHTTRHSELFRLWENTFVFDTPGFSSLEIPELELGQLRFYYPELTEYEGTCRFQGCLHLSEPDCSVKKAVKMGKISKSRYDTYRGFCEELKSRRRRYD